MTLTVLAAFAVGTIAVARAVRLVTSDAYPPVRVLRERWEVWQANRDLDPDPNNLSGERQGVAHGWGPLLTCPFCFAPYAAAVDLTWAYLAGVDGDSSWSVAWWLVNLWAAVSYLAAMLVVRDEPVDD